MKRKTLLLLMLLALLAPWAAKAQTTVKMGPDGADHTFPFNNFYKNSWNQMIYTAEELGGAQTISSISFLIGGVPTTNWSATNVKIYLGHTSLCGSTGNTDLTTSDWVPSSSLVQVYSSSSYTPTTVTSYTDYAQNWWVNISFSTSFSYNGTDNLAVVVASQCSTYQSGLTFKYITDAHNQCIYRRNDSDTSYASHPGPNTGTLSKNRPVIKLCGSTAYGNVVNIKKTTVTSGSDIIFVDEGGDGGDCSTSNTSGNYYTLYATYRHIFSASTGGGVKVTFSEFCTEGANWDYMYVYDGYNNYSNDLSGKLGGSLSTMPGPFTSTGQSMTFTWRADSSNNAKGWKATIQYVTVATYSLTVNANPAAYGTVSPTSGTYTQGATQSITATPGTGYRLVNWTVSGTGATLSSNTSNPTTFTMGTANATVTANFEVTPSHTLTVNASPTTGGTVSPTSGTYYEGQTVNITATPASGYVFAGWTGASVANASSASTTFTMGTANATLTANFLIPEISGGSNANCGTKVIYVSTSGNNSNNGWNHFTFTTNSRDFRSVCLFNDSRHISCH